MCLIILSCIIFNLSEENKTVKGYILIIDYDIFTVILGISY